MSQNPRQPIQPVQANHSLYYGPPPKMSTTTLVVIITSVCVGVIAVFAIVGFLVFARPRAAPIAAMPPSYARSYSTSVTTMPYASPASMPFAYAPPPPSYASSLVVHIEDETGTPISGPQVYIARADAPRKTIENVLKEAAEKLEVNFNAAPEVPKADTPTKNELRSMRDFTRYFDYGSQAETAWSNVITAIAWSSLDVSPPSADGAARVKESLDRKIGSLLAGKNFSTDVSGDTAGISYSEGVSHFIAWHVDKNNRIYVWHPGVELRRGYPMRITLTTAAIAPAPATPSAGGRTFTPGFVWPRR